MKNTNGILILVLALLFAGCTTAKNKEQNKNSDSGVAEQREVKPINKTENMTKVLFKTTMGDITVALYDETPKHKANFIKLVNEKFYDGVLFHRIIQHFMIQTGDPDSKNAKPEQMLGNGGPGYTIPAEFVPSLIHKRGALAAARQGDNVNPTKASSGSQFYIVDGQRFTEEQLRMLSANYNLNFTPEQINTYTTIGGAPHLDGGYTVFGEVIEGMNIVDSIAAQPNNRANRPLQDIKILTATVLE